MCFVGSNREDFKKKKLLEEARKTGRAPAEVDEEGRAINPHIPEYISKAPWYLNTEHPTLKHQRAEGKEERAPSDLHQIKGFISVTNRRFLNLLLKYIFCAYRVKGLQSIERGPVRTAGL